VWHKTTQNTAIIKEDTTQHIASLYFYIDIYN